MIAKLIIQTINLQALDKQGKLWIVAGYHQDNSSLLRVFISTPTLEKIAKNQIKEKVYKLNLMIYVQSNWYLQIY